MSINVDGGLRILLSYQFSLFWQFEGLQIYFYSVRVLTLRMHRLRTTGYYSKV